MSDSYYGRIMRDGLWDNNVPLSQMLALCPALATTTSATNGLGMGISTVAVMVVCSLLVSLLRNYISPQVRIPAFVALIAGTVTLVDMALNAWMHSLYQVLGLYIALIVSNCAVLGRAEVFAAKQPVLPSMIDAAAMGLGFTWVLVLMGAMREILGSGTLFAHASSLLGPHFAWLETTVLPNYQGVLIMILPPGAFLVLGFLLAAKRKIDQYLRERERILHGGLPVLN
jgi:Na+-translocating ferredoxin:NAD+ oxidoreductase subunit E